LVLDIIVIGGGPIGSQVAYRLAAVGRSVAVVEKREGIGQKPCCTGIISQECVSAFGIPPRVILKQTYSANLFSPAGETIKINRPETCVCVVDRPEFDRVLAERAQNAGSIYHLSALAEHITVYQDRVIVDMENCGRRRHLEAQCAVLATGFNANLVKELGFGRVSYFAAGAQTEVELDGVEEIEVYLSQFLSPGFFSWLVPTSNGKGMVGLLTHLRPGLRLQEVLVRLESQGKIKQGNHQIKYGGIPLKPLSRHGETDCWWLAMQRDKSNRLPAVVCILACFALILPQIHCIRLLPRVIYLPAASSLMKKDGGRNWVVNCAWSILSAAVTSIYRTGRSTGYSAESIQPV
jgi:flavin-dependent dehydrogenase